MSEWFKELVLKTSDSQEPWVRIPLSPPPFSPTTESLAERSSCRSTQAAIRGSPAKGVDRETGARVRIPPSAPSRSKLCIACSDLFYKSGYARFAVLSFPLHPASSGSQWAGPACGRYSPTVSSRRKVSASTDASLFAGSDVLIGPYPSTPLKKCP